MEITTASIKTRQAFLSLLYEGKDISEQIAPYVCSFSYTDKAPVKTLTRGETAIKSFRFKDKTDDVYDEAEVAYHDPAGKETKRFSFKNPYAGDETQTYVKGSGKKKKRGDKLMVNRRIDDHADGTEYVAADARDKNQDENDGSMTLLGDLDLRSTMTVGVAGFKRFDMVYSIETATHAFDRSSGYTTELKLRKTLEY
jgi:phage protein D